MTDSDTFADGVEHKVLCWDCRGDVADDVGVCKLVRQTGSGVTLSCEECDDEIIGGYRYAIVEVK